MDVAAEDLDALLLVGLQQRRAGEPYEHRGWDDPLHRAVKALLLRRLGAVALVHEHEEVALGGEAGRQSFLQLRDVAGDVADLLAVLPGSELLDE